LALPVQLSEQRLLLTGRMIGRIDAEMRIVKKIALPSVGIVRERTPKTTAKRSAVKRSERKTPTTAKIRSERSVAMTGMRRLEMSDVNDAEKKDVVNVATIDMMTDGANDQMIGTRPDAQRAKLRSLKSLWIPSNIKSTMMLSLRQTTSGN
jgi:hypothetical protein